MTHSAKYVIIILSWQNKQIPNAPALIPVRVMVIAGPARSITVKRAQKPIAAGMIVLTINRSQNDSLTQTASGHTLKTSMLLSFGYISEQWVWVAMVIIFALVEVFTFGLTTVWFAIAALIMVFLSLLNIPMSVQILIFLGISGVLLIFTRPLAIKKFKMGKAKTNVDSLAGKHALVVKPIGEFDAGEAKISGQIWTARAENNAEISEGTKCEVIRVEGVQLIVRPLEEV